MSNGATPTEVLFLIEEYKNIAATHDKLRDLLSRVFNYFLLVSAFPFTVAGIAFKEGTFDLLNAPLGLQVLFVVVGLGNLFLTLSLIDGRLSQYRYASHGLLDYAGERIMPADVQQYRNWQGNQIENRYSHWIWRQYASAFWDDVRIGRVLPYKQARDAEDEKHIHPLQLDVIDRCLVLWSNPGETVLTPFMGVGSEVYAAVSQGRRGIGIELKPTYYRQAVKNIAAASREHREGKTQGELIGAKP